MLPIFAAAQIVAAAKEETGRAGRALVETIRSQRFDTAVGTVRFGRDHSAGRGYELRISQGGALVPLDGSEPATR